ncbi:hypothetical protein HK405_011524, partial [Cladochytrium tenue]
MHLSHRVRDLVQLFHDILLVPPDQTTEHELGTAVPVTQVADDQDLLARLLRLADLLEAELSSAFELGDRRRPSSGLPAPSRHAVLLQRKRAAQAAWWAELDAHLRDVAKYSDRRRRDDKARDSEEARRDELKRRIEDAHHVRMAASEAKGTALALEIDVL